MQNLPQISTFIKYNKMNYWKNEIKHTDIENTRSNFFIIKFSEHKSGVSDWDKSFSMLPLIYAAYAANYAAHNFYTYDRYTEENTIYIYTHKFNTSIRHTRPYIYTYTWARTHTCARVHTTHTLNSEATPSFPLLILPRPYRSLSILRKRLFYTD